MDILELDQTGRTSPGALLVLPAMVLQSEAAARGKIGNGSPGNDGLSVQHNFDGFPLGGDLKMVPFAGWPICLGARGGGGTQVRCSRRVGADAVQFARADGPAPD